MRGVTPSVHSSDSEAATETQSRMKRVHRPAVSSLEQAKDVHSLQEEDSEQWEEEALGQQRSVVVHSPLPGKRLAGQGLLAFQGFGDPEGWVCRKERGYSACTDCLLVQT